jgi:hypothetical protein
MTNLLRCAVFVVLSCVVTGSAAPKATPAIGATHIASLPLEVRLRRLHLVRPDLIPYPLCIETFC